MNLLVKVNSKPLAFVEKHTGRIYKRTEIDWYKSESSHTVSLKDMMNDPNFTELYKGDTVTLEF